MCYLKINVYYVNHTYYSNMLTGQRVGKEGIFQFFSWEFGQHWLFMDERTEALGEGDGNTVQYSWASLVAHGEGSSTPPQYSCLENPMNGGAWWAAVHGIARSRTWLSDFTFTFHFHALEKEMATHSSVLSWRILGTREPGGLPSMGLHRVGHDWSNLAAAAAELRS